VRDIPTEGNICFYAAICG